MRFFLIVVTHEELRAVTDVVVFARGELGVVLVEDFGLNVVITLGLIRIGVNTRIELHQGQHIRIQVSGRNVDVVPSVPIGCATERLQRRAVQTGQVVALINASARAS